MTELPREIGIAFDMHGCPNRCRHCWLALLPNASLSEKTVREITQWFRSFARPGEASPFFRKVWVSTNTREPDFSDEYRRLYDLESELSDGKPWRYELLSIWRLARDPQYALWAKSIGPDTCQISFFGGENTTDWFCRRKGAYRDCLTATERLLESGMKPRWQLFANTKGINELDELLCLADQMRIPQRVEALGACFNIFVYVWGVCGAALGIEHLRPTAEDMTKIPRRLLELSVKHFGQDVLWRSEAELCSEILSRNEWYGYGMEPGHMGWFEIAGNMDVYFNAYGVESCWCLGNLARESLSTILGRFEEDNTPGRRLIASVPAQRLVRDFGNLQGRQVHSSADDLLRLYLFRHLALGGR